MPPCSRRKFLERSMFAAATAAMSSRGSTVCEAEDSPVDSSEVLRVAVVGVNGRGAWHTHCFGKRTDCVVAAIVDVDEVVANKRADAIERDLGQRPVVYTDMRQCFEDKSIHIVSIATPNPPITLGISSLPTYTLRPGLLILFNPEITLSFSTYFGITLRIPCFLSFNILYARIKPSSFNIFAISNFIFEIGISTFSDLICVEFRILVSISAIGSVSIHYLHNGHRLPARLYYSRYLSLERKCSETNPAHPELTQVGPGPST